MATNHARVLKALKTPGSPLNPLPTERSFTAVCIAKLAAGFGRDVVAAAIPGGLTPLVERLTPYQICGPEFLSGIVKRFLLRKTSGVAYKVDQTYRTDPNRPEGEGAECSVAAMIAATGWSYGKAHDVLARFADRKVGKGARLHKMLHGDRATLVCDRMFYPACKVSDRAPTLAQFIRGHSKGRFLATKWGHAFAIVDGVVVDNGGMNAKNPARVRVRYAWRVEPLDNDTVV